MTRAQTLAGANMTPISSPRDSKKVRLIVIVVLAIVVAYLLYSMS